jgi:hypothetical protein
MKTVVLEKEQEQIQGACAKIVSGVSTMWSDRSREF